jgi:hypothetical protein
MQFEVYRGLPWLIFSSLFIGLECIGLQQQNVIDLTCNLMYIQTKTREHDLAFIVNQFRVILLCQLLHI